jgi:hypothetical protein
MYFPSKVLSKGILFCQPQVLVSWQIMIEIQIFLLLFVGKVTNKQELFVMKKHNAAVTTKLEVE